MRRFTVLCFLSVFMCVIFAPRAWADVEINETNFPDENFRKYVSENRDSDKDGYLSEEEIKNVISMYVTRLSISSLKGIEYFTALKTLNCEYNQLTELDVSKNTALEYLYCANNQLTALDVSSNTALTQLACDSNQLTALDVSNNTALTWLNCWGNQLTALDVSKNTALEYLYCTNNQLTALDVSNNAALIQLDCGNNQLIALDLSNNTALTGVAYAGQKVSGFSVIFTGDTSSPYKIDFSGYISTGNFTKISSFTAKDSNDAEITTTYANGVAQFASLPSTVTYNYATGKTAAMDVTMSDFSLFIEINGTTFPDEAFRAYVSNNLDTDNDGYLSIKAVTSIDVSGQGISSLQGIEYFTALTSLDCSENQLTALDVSNNAALIQLDCGSNQLTELDLSENTALTDLSCGGQTVSGFSVIFTGDTSYPYKMDFSGYISSDNIAKISSVTAKDSGDAAITTTYADGVAQFASLPSTVTYNYATGYDTTAMDVTISGMSLAVVINATNFPDEAFRAYVSNNLDTDNDGILSPEEIAAVTNINVSAKGISSLKGIEYFTALTYLYCYGNQLTELDLSNNTVLAYLYCRNNQLTALDMSKNTALKTLHCYNNQLTALDVSNNIALTDLDCSTNQLTTLDLSDNTALKTLHCYNNQLTALDVSNNIYLTDLRCSTNQLAALDVSNNTALTELACNNNQLTELDIHNCPKLTLGNLTADSTVLIIHGDMDGLPAFGDHSLVLSGQLGLDFYANVPEGTNTDGAYADFTVNDKTGSPEMFSNADQVGDDYRFTCYINSVQMADTITAKFCYSDDTKNMAAVQDCTVTDYLDAIISSTDIQAKSPDLVALAEAIKDYGHYVQIPLSKYNSWDIGTDHAEIECVNQNIDSDSADVKTKLQAYALNKDIEGSGIENLTYDLELESETTLNIYLTPGSDAGNVSAYITDDDNEFDGKTNMAVYDSSENAYVVTIGGISAHKLGRVYTVSITTGKGENFYVKISALSYANGVMQAEKNIDDDLKRAMISLYKYYAATMKYRGETLSE